MATAAVLCIGTELTRGEIVNSNASFLAEELTRNGFEVTAIETVDDHEGRIEESLLRLGADHAVIVATGGLGPTTDDISTAAVAKLLGVSLVRDDVSLAAIRERFLRAGRTMSPSNEKQADFPKGAVVLPNPNGTAPGFSVRIGRAHACFMPGVPREMKAMFAASVVPAILPLIDEAFHQVRIKTFGLPESEVNDRLAGIAAKFDVVVGYRASFPVIEVKLLARASDAASAQGRARSAADEARQRLGAVVFGEGDTTLADALGQELAARSLRLACGESCTGGLLGQLLTARGGASEFFLGSAVVYDNRAKTAVLGVEAGLISAHGAVSAEVARALAQGALERFDADVGIGVTGIAGPGGGTPDKPVGLVHYAVATSAGSTARFFTFPGDREMVRMRAAYAALGLALSIARHGHPQEEEFTALGPGTR